VGGAADSPRGKSEWKPALAAGARRLLDSFGDYVARYPDAVAQLAVYRTEHPGPGIPLARLARTLALAPDAGLLVSELRAIHPDIEGIRDVLAAYPAFVQTDRWRWTLGALPG